MSTLETLKDLRAQNVILQRDIRAAVHAAAAEGHSEVKISDALGMSRHTVRAWLGKPQRRVTPLLPGRCRECDFWAVDADAMGWHVRDNH